MRFGFFFVALWLGLAPSAWADFSKVDGKDAFVSAISGKTLRRMGIRLVVAPNGSIQGRAFGRDVTGDWTWQNGYFCRDLTWGKRELEYNCQWVGLNTPKIRFRSDRGTGMFADFRLE
ncbi:MAG: dihydrodipicolinate reductase [Pseudomonadota bacterium]